MGCGGSTVRDESNGTTGPHQHTSNGHTERGRQGDTSKTVCSENDPQNRNGPHTQQNNEAEFGEPLGWKKDTGTLKIDGKVITTSSDEDEGDPHNEKIPLVKSSRQNGTEEKGDTHKPPDGNNNNETRPLFSMYSPKQQPSNSQAYEETASVPNSVNNNKINLTPEHIPKSNGISIDAAPSSSGLVPPQTDTGQSSPQVSTQNAHEVQLQHHSNTRDVSEIPSQAIIRSSNAPSSDSSGPLENKKEPSKKEKDSRPPKETNLERIRREALEVHNVYRARHGVPPLVLSGKINNIAQRWAETMAKTGKFEHSPSSSRPGCGENIYYSWSTAFDINAVTGGKATKAFYDEIDDYDFNKPGEIPASGKIIGHFTALIWKNSKELGVGMATSKKGKRGHVYICCNYSPPGNWRGAENYIENVPPLLPNIGSLEPINVENEKFEDEDSIDDKDELEKETTAPSGVNMTHLERIRLEVLEMHNVYRAKHGVPPLTPSKKINKYAQRWAETMAKTGKFEHSPNGQRPNCGENIYFAGSTNFDLANINGGQATTSFYDEIKDYNFKKPGEKPKSGKVIGHFTALVWKDSKELGVGMATSKKGKWGYVYICCNYSPPGNWIGAENYVKNVLPPTSGS